MAEHVSSLAGFRRNLIAEALITGAGLGIIAQVLRQVQGETMQFGAATAPWLSVGFAMAVLAARRREAGRVLAVYLISWLVAYHILYAVGQSVPLSAASREALPWLVLSLPVCVALTRVATLARGRGLVADACLAVPIAWSLPETVSNARRSDFVVAATIAVLALLPVAAAQRRDFRIATIAIAVALFAAVAFLVGPIVRSHIHS